MSDALDLLMTSSVLGTSPANRGTLDGMASTGDTWQLGRRPALDGLRGVAILLVVAGHVAAPYYDAAGHVGVTMFFVLSGFLITTLLCEERESVGHINFRQFYRRRAARLIPALIAMVGACVTISLVMHQAFVTPRDVLGALLYSSNLIGGLSAGMLHHTWSLVIEEQFYLVLPAVLLVCWRRRATLGLVLAFGVVAVAAWRVHLWDAGAGLSRVLFGTDSRIDGILVGVVLALALRRGLPKASDLLAAICLLVCLLLSILGALTFVYGFTVVALASAGIIVGIMDGRAPRLLSSRFLVYVGQRSYGLYLWHHPVLIFSDRVLGTNQNPLTTGLVVLPASAVLTWLSWRYIEQPFMKRGDQETPETRRRNSYEVTALVEAPQLEVSKPT